MQSNRWSLNRNLYSRLFWRSGVLAFFMLLAFFGLVFSLVKGAVNISPEDIVRAICYNGGDPMGQIVWNIRLPRSIVGALVGMNLALSGAILQAVMKNPLADPHIIGVSSGAGLAGIIVLVLFPTMDYLLTPAAFIGALISAGIIYLLAWKGGIRPIRIILAGVAVSAFLGSGISSLLILYSDRVHGALVWMVGGLAARSWPHVFTILPYSIGAGLLAFLSASYLNVLSLGDEVSRGLGLRVELTRIVLTAIAVLLAASAVSVVGLLGFVGLIVPHAARLLIGSDYRFLLPASALLGIGVVTISDTLARILFTPLELPVGIIMAFVGAPFFLYLLRRES
ncbi:MAG: hmuU 3 [Firmicutes bacterium]|nr:hmuU 3 [Bacillota bacterium]